MRSANIPRRPCVLGALPLLLTLSACGAANSAGRPSGTPDLTKALPAPTPSPFGLAYGDRQPGMTGRHGSRADLEAYLKPARLAPHRPSVARSSPVLAPARGVPPGARASADSPLAARALASASSATPDSQRYAQRQSKSRNLERYRGGDVIVIGASTLVIVLLIVLIIVLLI
jgi:hypothetical protein